VKTNLIKHSIFIFPWTDDIWILRQKIIKVIKICSKFDSINFFCQTKLERILPNLVAMIGTGPDMFGKELVETITQLSINALSVNLLKPLNYQVLLMSKSPSEKTTLMSLEIIYNLIITLKEEYSIVLPETKSYIREILEESSEIKINKKCQEILKQLEI
jgi:hypothetical protein